MEQMIQKRLKIIEDLSDEMRGLKENMQDMLDNDPLYQEMQEKSAEVKEEGKAVKMRMLNGNQTYVRIEEELKDKRQDLKENKEALSVELVEHYKKHGTFEITDADGTVKRMKFSVRLVS